MCCSNIYAHNIMFTGFDKKEQTKMKIYSFPEGYCKTSDDFKLFCCGKNIPLYTCNVSAYPFNRVWNGTQRPFNQTEKAAFVSFGCDTSVSVLIETKLCFKDVTVRPLSKNITPEICESSVKITFPAPGQYTVEFDGIHKTIAVFINPEKNFDIDTNDKDVLYFPPGVHIFDERIELEDNQTLFLDEGAVLFGSINATDKENLKILGYGIIDNSRMYRADEINGCSILAKNRPIQSGNPIFFDRCKNVIVDGVTVVDSSGWSIYADGCENILVNNIKLIGMWRYNADGCDFCNCTNGSLTNSFLRTFDDCVTVKGFKLNNTLPVENITVDNCVLWCDWGRALEVGAETCAPYIKDVLFTNCDIIHGSGVMLDVQHGDSSDINNVRFENINLEYSGSERKLVIQKNDADSYPDTKTVHTPTPFAVTSGATMWSIDDHAGNIYNVYFRNINIISMHNTIPQSSPIGARESGSHIENVYFENIYVNGKKCTLEDLNLKIGENVKNIVCS